MPRYLFDFRKGEKLISDEHGTELPDLEAAKAEAFQALVELAKGEGQMQSGRTLAIEVRVHDKPLLRVSLTLDVSPLP